MRILYVTDNYPPAGGGMERSVSTMASALASRGHDVAVATLSRLDAPAWERRDGIEVHRLDGWVRHLRRFAADPGHQYHPTVRDPGLVVRLQRLVDTFRPDIIDVSGWIMYSALPLRLERGAVLIVSLHDFSLICNNKTLLRDGRVCSGPAPVKCVRCAAKTYGVSRGVPLAVGLLGHRSGYRRADHFIANSAYVADHTAGESGVDRDRITVISPPSLDDSAAPAPRPDFLPDGDFVLFVGAMGRHKGLDVLLDAHALLEPPVPLVVLGLPRADAPDCDRPGVTVVENVPRDQVLASWAAAAVGAVPSVCAEAFGLVAVEAMSAATAVVVTAVGGLQEVVEDGVTGLVVPPGDSRSLASGLQRLLGDAELRAAMGIAGRERARRYTTAVVVPQFESCYEQVLRDARQRVGSS